MKNLSRSLGLCALLACTGVGQTIPNAGFETWVGDSTLTGWLTSNIPGFFRNVTRSTAARSGSSAVQGTVISGFVAGTTYSAFIQSGVNGVGSPINTRPGALRGWYRFFSDSGDGLNIITSLTKARVGVGVGVLAITAPQSVYQEFVVNTLWVNGETPDTAIINITLVGGGARTHIGSTFFIDDLTWGAASDVKEIAGSSPTEFRLEPNYPNPFNPQTTIQFHLPIAQDVSLTVFNVLGQQVAELVDGKLERGNYRAQFEAGQLPGGTYFYRLRAGKYVATRTMVLLK